MKARSALLDSLSSCLARYETHYAGAGLLAAVSGGRDSLVLLRALIDLRDANRLPAPLIVAHVDHGAHADSAAAAARVRAVAARYELPFYTERLQEVAPTEAAWRNARYDALVRMARACDARVVLTAHHADDDLETVLFRVLRGTGPRGLAGIPEFRPLTPDIAVLRPLLRFRARELHACLGDLEAYVQDDPTNADRRYARNRIRHELVPALREAVGEHLDATLLALADAARRVTAILEAQASRLLGERAAFATDWRCELTLPRDAAADPAVVVEALPRNFLEEAICQLHTRLHPARRRPRWSFVGRSLSLLELDAGRRLQVENHLTVERTRQGLLFVDPSRAGAPPTAPILLPLERPIRFGTTEFEVRARTCVEPPLVPSPSSPQGPLHAVLDPRGGAPHQLRTRRSGDRFWPLGAPRPVDLRRFLQARHVPRFDRDRLPLLVDEADRILWIPGVEIAAPSRVQLDTSECFAVHVSILGGATGTGTSY